MELLRQPLLREVMPVLVPMVRIVCPGTGGQGSGTAHSRRAEEGGLRYLRAVPFVLQFHPNAAIRGEFQLARSLCHSLASVIDSGQDAGNFCGDHASSELHTSFWRIYQGRSLCGK